MMSHEKKFGKLVINEINQDKLMSNFVCDSESKNNKRVHNYSMLDKSLIENDACSIATKKMKSIVSSNLISLVDSDRSKDISFKDINGQVDSSFSKNISKSSLNDNEYLNSPTSINSNKILKSLNDAKLPTEINGLSIGGITNDLKSNSDVIENPFTDENSTALIKNAQYSLDYNIINEESEDDDNYLDSSGTEEIFEKLEQHRQINEEDSDDDDQSVISSITVGSTCSLRSAASETMGSIYMNENGIASNEDGSLLYGNFASATPLKVLRCSMFPHVPPTINFCKFDETTESPSEDVSKLLKWKFTTITPVIVRKTITNSGFKIIKKTPTWCGTWGKHMKLPCFKLVKEYQKINHFPGSFQIGRKDKLWKNFLKLQLKFGKNEFGFIPKTFVIPDETAALKAAFTKEGPKKKWIVKPPASARGAGIQVVDKWSQLQLDSPVVVQRYISRPYLINNTKFDIRLYVLLASVHPLRVFLYEDGLVRFASVPYQAGSKTLSDRFMHLTNYSVNKASSTYTHNDDAGHCHGHKWTLKTLWGYLKAKDVDTAALWSRIVDIVVKTVLCGENEIAVRTKKFSKNMYNCFELFGFDVILDERLRPWLLEVNISPSLHSASALDHSVKGPLIADLLNLVGYHIPDKLSQDRQMELLDELKLSENVSGLCLDRRLYTRLLTLEEQLKHVRFSSLSRHEWLKEILEKLQPNDIRQLIMAEDQRSRAGNFSCVFPTPDTHNYFGFMSKVRYYNRLLDAWETRYGPQRTSGIELLRNLCQTKLHLKVTSRFKLPKTACLPPVEKFRSPEATSTENDTLAPCLGAETACSSQSHQSEVPFISPNDLAACSLTSQ